MKTTVDIPDNLSSEAKKLAVEDGASFKVIVESALRQMLNDQKRRNKTFRLRKHPYPVFHKS